MWWLLAVFVISIVVTYFHKKPQRKVLNNRHVVITGGSSGIGKCLAVLAARKGAHVTILARNKVRLNAAAEEIQRSCVNPEQIVTQVSVNVSDYEALRKEIKKLEEFKPIYGLVNCAGIAICGKLEDIPTADIDTMIGSNFLGSLYPTKLVIPGMKRRKEGFVVFTGSQVSLMGMFGYTVYSACKFALRGLAESLDMEVRHLNVSVTLALPADTDTPGYEQENKSKPVETKLMSEAGGLHKPEIVAEQILDDALVGRFFSYAGLESGILATLCVGMSPFLNWMEVALQVLLLGPVRIVGVYYLNMFHRIIAKQNQQSS